MLRVGTVPYLVARPLDTGLEDEPGIELTYRIPSELVEGLRGGEIDVALVSSIELFRRVGYSYLDGLAVAGRGFVSSVQIFLKKPVEQVQTVALDPASRAAATLSKVIWPAQERRRPMFLNTEWGTDPRDVDADAWLRIGDAALREYLSPDSPPVLNPAQLWYETSGLPFVFAAWVVAPGVSVEEWVPAFTRARTRGSARIEALAQRAARRWNVPPEATLRYLAEECLFEPGKEMEPALLAFQHRAAKMGLCFDTYEPKAIPAPVSAP